MKAQLILILALLLLAGSVSAQDNKASASLTAAIYEEEVTGNLDKAVQLYLDILKKYPNDRQIAAKALYHLGLVNEKMGKQKASEYFTRLINSYPDQTEMVALAKSKLNILKATVYGSSGRAVKDLTFTKLYKGSVCAISMSPDGRQLALIRPELSTRDIWIRNIETGKEIRLTNSINPGWEIVWSPNNQWLAFADQDRDIMVISVNGGSIRTLFNGNQDTLNTKGIAPTGWTPDSHKVLFHIPSKGLFAVSVTGGAPEPLCTFENPDEARKHEGMTLSPNGQWVAYSAPLNGNTDIFIMSTDKKSQNRITTGPTADTKPCWSPDGKWIAFTSSGIENPQIWAIRISPRGEPEGLPVQISKEAYALGGNWTGEASFGLPAASRIDHIFISKVDGTEEIQLTQFASFNSNPRWSPDGGKIAFKSDYRKPLNKFQLWTVPSAGGTPRLASDKEVSNFIWSDDGEKILLKTVDESHQPVFLKIPVSGRVPEEIKLFPGNADVINRSPDGQNIAYIFTVEPAQFATAEELMKERMSGIGIVPITGGKPRILIPAEKKGIWFSDCQFDPEGKRIAYIMFDYSRYGKEGMYSVWTMDVNGGTPRQITMEGEYSLCWSPDAKWIVFEKRITGMDFELYKVPAEGGDPVKMNIKGRSPEFSPDGKKIAYSRRAESGYEYWLAENFLPKEKTSATASAMTATRVWANADITGKVSPDGRFVSCTDWETGDIAFHDLITGQNRRLTDGSNPDAIIEYSVPSPDSKSIAYYWWSDDDSYDLRVVSLDGSKPKVLKTSEKEIHHFVPIAWSPDGKYLLSEFVKTDGNSNMMLINVSDSSAKLLKEKGKGLPSDGDFSPDGRYIAWSAREGISLFELQTGIESLLIPDQSNHSVLGWAPDGKYVMFSSERSGSPDAWLIAVDKGKAKGEPMFIKKNWGFLPMGISRSGAFFYGVNNNVWGVKIAEIDPAGGKVVSPLQSAFRQGNMRGPDWSPDGRFLAGIDGSEPSQAVIIHSMDTNEERELRVGDWIIGMGSLRWTPDGKAVVAPASATGKGDNLIRIDLQTGQVTPLMKLPALGGWPRFAFSKDGNIIYYQRPDPSKPSGSQLVAHDLRSGQETEISEEQGIYISKSSPDGQRLLIAKAVDNGKSQVILTMPVSGGETKELVKVDGEKEIPFWGNASWTSDGRYVVFLKGVKKEGQKYKDMQWQLWRVLAEGGEAIPLGLTITGQLVGPLQLQPNGRHVVIGDVGVNLEVWVMENFLPK